MKGLSAIGQFIHDNYALILIVLLFIGGGVAKFLKFMNMSTQEKREAIAKEVDNLIQFIKEGVVDLITEAEQTYGSGTGPIKKSKVYNKIMELLPCLEDYIIDGDISSETIGHIIDAAVAQMNELAGTNEKIADIYAGEPATPPVGYIDPGSTV